MMAHTEHYVMSSAEVILPVRSLSVGLNAIPRRPKDTEAAKTNNRHRLQFTIEQTEALILSDGHSVFLCTKHVLDGFSLDIFRRDEWTLGRTRLRLTRLTLG